MSFTKNTFRILAIVGVLTGMFVSHGIVSASNGTNLGGASSISVDFQTVPMFLEVNFVPGETVEKYAFVTNSSEQVRQIFVTARNAIGCINENSCISDVLYLTVSDSDQTYFNGTLKEFYFLDALSLGEIAPTASKYFYFDIYFAPESSNLFQNQITGFNMLMAFEGDEGGIIDEPEEPPVTPPAGGGGGGGSSGGGGGGILAPHKLEITNVRVTDINVAQGTAIVRWETNYPADSQVVFGLESAGPFSLSLTENNFGYPIASIVGTDLTTVHSMLLYGLSKETTYLYRVVSRERLNTLPTISLENSFKLSTEKVVTPPPPFRPTGGNGPISNIKPIEKDDSGSLAFPDNLEGPQNNDRNLAAVIFGLPESWKEFFLCFFLLIFIIILAILVWMTWAREYSKERHPQTEEVERRDYFAIIWGVIALILALIFREYCLWLPILILIIMTLVHLLLQDDKEEDEDIQKGVDINSL